ncbi:peptidase C14 [Komarekiella sp. 'clone 1']|uniref:Peptidase C14 n=1 Tax=Komarekiella delphini-convector SJRDD-AB1 TaxID=2593771 RepID=A0AA40VQ74_9NOST|nr:caspase family protein [Komarekiella delphini-convector]MBD6616004.1 peptidase C14 [Komarekiella delphini-convector SJRDD-AB1]
MKRRTFLHTIGSILAVLGITEAEWLTLGNRYYQALAQPSSRKLALLIGINQYPHSALSGCLTDVELQRELLMHRFGFQASDILTLTEEQASREFIEAAFLDHLGQAKLGDVVIFHFSGYGTRVSGTSLDAAGQNALVPASENKISQDEKIVNYLLEETVLLLLRSLPTNRVTAVLDTSYDAPGTAESGSRIRARKESVDAQLAAAELDFLKQLKTKTSLSPNTLVLSATSDPKQLAREGVFSDFSAGLFTYALTQHLWESTPATTIQFILSNVESSLYKLGSKQQPALVNDKKNSQGVLAENFLPEITIGAQGAVTAVEEDGKTVHLWLAGLPPQVLEYYGVNSRLTLSTGEQLILRSRTGLTAKAHISSIDATIPLQGQLVQEAIRVLPRNIDLTIALDTELERIERVDATSAFAATIPRVSSVVAREQPADYVLGKLEQTPSRYGLFSLGGELILNTAGEAGEAVKVAVQRLAPKFKTLLAAKLWRLTENAGSSGLAVKATLEIINNISPRVIMQRQTLRTLSSEKSISKSPSIPTVPIGSRMQYRVQNLGDRPLYLILVGLKNNRTAVAFYPWQATPEPNNPDTKPLLTQVIITPGETLTLPHTTVASDWVISGPAFFCEQQLILSTTPLSETFAALDTAKYSTADQQLLISTLLNPLEVSQALLQDLHNASAVKAEMNNIATDSYILDVNNWASLSFSFQVV